MHHEEQSESLHAEFKRITKEVLLQRTRLASQFCIFIVPAAILMDMVIYPNDFTGLAIYRVACALVMIVIVAFCGKPIGQNYTKWLTYSFLLTMFSYTTLLLALTDGVQSPYYGGFNLIMLGASLLFPWKTWECFVAGLLAILFYILGCWGNLILIGFENWQFESWFTLFFPKSFMQIANTALCLVATHFSGNLRFRDFKLQYELDEKSRELEKSYQKLSELDRAKSRFFANISHELRSPLTLIIAPIEKLQNQIQEVELPEVKQTLDIMRSNAMRLLSLINDLLDLVRLEDGKLKLKLAPIPLQDVLLGLLASIRMIATQKGLKLECHVDEGKKLYLNADRDKIEKVFLNLLFNAVKFTPEGGSISISARSEFDRAIITIQDSGIGIESEKLTTVFDRFWQDENNADLGRQGAGIGLSLVKELVELHKGTVEIASEKGIGTTFTLILPTAAEGEIEDKESNTNEENWLAELHDKAKYHYVHTTEINRGQAVNAKSSSIRKHTLLIVEDEPEMMRYLEMELKNDYNLFLASDGKMGLEMAQRHQPDLILSDMMLPKMDGISLCKKIKSSPSLRPLKFVMLTARADDSTKLAALEAGADDFVTKPFSTLELKARLANILLNVQLERELFNQNLMLEETLRQLRSTEAQLIQSERLSALGTLSAGIMHEINNPVNIMMTAMSYLRGSIASPTENNIETLDDIDGELKRVRDIIADIKGFAQKRSEGVKDKCEPAAILQTSKRLLADQIKNDIDLIEEIDLDHCHMYGNQNQLVQLLVNLIQNAIHATQHNEEKGKDRVVKVGMKVQSSNFVITIKDNGSGITKENERKIFDPFFTTKEAGEGSGLGLSICQKIIEQHNGKISINSKIDEFTEFTVTIPTGIDPIQVNPPPIIDSIDSK